MTFWINEAHAQSDTVPLDISASTSESTSANTEEASLSQQGDPLAGFLPIIVIFFIFWLFLFRPQSKRAKEHKEMLNGLGRGDKIITSGGIIGKVIRVENDNSILDVEIAKDTVVKVSRGMVSECLSSKKADKVAA